MGRGAILRIIRLEMPKKEPILEEVGNLRRKGIIGNA